MALNPKDLQDLNKIMRVMAASGDEITKKTRELMTVLYAFQQGFVNLEGGLTEALADMQSGKWEGPNLKKYLKNLELSDEIIDDILDKRKELEKIDSRRIDNATTYKKMLSVLYDLEDDRFNLASRLTSEFDRLNDQLVDQERLLKSTGVSLSGNTDLLTKQIQKRHELSNVFQNEIIDQAEIAEQLDTVSELIDNISAKSFTISGMGKLDPAQAVSALEGISDMQITLLEKEDQIRRQKLKEFAAWASGYTINLETGDIFNSDGEKMHGKVLENITNMLDNQADRYERLIDQSNSQSGISTETLSTMSEIEKVIIRQAASQKKLNTLNSQSLENYSKNLELLMKFRPALRAAQEAGDGLAKGVQTGLDQIPSSIQKILGIEDAAQGIKDSTKGAIKAFNSELGDSGNLSKAVGASLKKWGGGISKSVGLVGIFAATLGGAFAVTKMIEHNFEELAHKLHISVAQSKALYAQNLKLVSSYKNQFLTLKDISDVQQAYVHATGQVFDLSRKGGQKLALELGEISKAFGYSAEMGIEVYEVFSALGADKKFANSLQRQLGYMSEMAGLSPSVVAHDMVDAAEDVATFFGGMPEKAGKAAIEMRRLGTNLKTAGNFAKKMLDLEGFMTDMFELAAMGGPDLSKAFELGVTGDVEGAMKAAMDAIGSLEEFNAMDQFQKMKLAGAMGVEVSELQKSLMLRKKLKGLGATETEQVMARLDKFGDIQDMDQQAIKDRLSQLHSTERLSVAWEKIRAQFIRAILPFAESFADTLEGASPLIDTIVGGFGLVADLVKGISWFVGGMLKPLSWVGMAVGKISKFFSDGEKKAKDTEIAIAGIGGEMKSLIGISGTAFGIWKFGGGSILKFIGKAIPGFTKLGDVVKGFGGQLMDKVKGLAPSMDGVGEKLKDKVKKLIPGQGGVGDTGKQLGAPASEGLDKAVKGASKVKKGMGAGIKEFLTGLGEGLTAMGTGKVLFGAANLIPASIGLVTMIPGAVGAKLISMVDGKSLGIGLRGMATGLEAMGSGKVMLGAAGLVLASIGFVAMIPGAVGMFLLGAAAPVAAAGLMALAPALTAFGGVMMSGVGLVGLAAFVGAAIGLAFALKQLAPTIEAFAPVIQAFGTVVRNAFEGLASVISAAAEGFVSIMGAVSLQNVAAMAALGPALISASIGMAAFAAASVMGGIGSLFGGGIMDDLKMVSEMADPLNVAAVAIDMLGEAITKLNSSLSNADFSKMEELKKLKGVATQFGIGFKMSGEGTTTAPASPPTAESTAQNVLIRESTGTQTSDDASDPVQQILQQRAAGGGSDRQMVGLLKQLIGEIQKMNSRPMVIEFDDGTIKTLNYRIKGVNSNR